MFVNQAARTYPRNFNEVMFGGRVTPRPTIRAFIVLIVTNSQWAFSFSGVSSVVQVRRVIEPSGPPVARTPRWEYSRSWKANAVMVGTSLEKEGVNARSSVAIGLAFMVCRHNFKCEQVAI
jgi:hypothetical protein